MSKAAKKTEKKELSPVLYDVIQSPVITEKSHKGSESNKYTFKVSSCADKGKVKQAVENLFGVTVTKVNIVVTKGKVKLFRGFVGKRKDVKKAIVTIATGQSIDIAKA